MAEGFLRHLAPDRFEALSAGTDPHGMNPDAVRVMREAGVDISGQRSKSVAEFLGAELDLVVTVCDAANERCPVFPGRVRRAHWPFDDPATATGTEEERLAVFRRVRDEIAARLSGFLASGGA